MSYTNVYGQKLDLSKFTVQVKPAWSTEKRERMGFKPDRIMVLGISEAVRDDGTRYPFVLSVLTGTPGQQGGMTTETTAKWVAMRSQEIAA